MDVKTRYPRPGLSRSPKTTSHDPIRKDSMVIGEKTSGISRMPKIDDGARTKSWRIAKGPGELILVENDVEAVRNEPTQALLRLV